MIDVGSRTLTVIIPGPPVGQGRPRFSTFGGHVKAYDPAKSREFKETLKSLVITAMREQGFDPLPASMPVEIKIISHRPITTSKAKWWKDLAKANSIVPSTKPDGSNVLKGIEDAMNGIVYHDDNQIFRILYEACFATEDNPRTEIIVTGYYQDLGELKDRLKKEQKKGKKK